MLPEIRDLDEKKWQDQLTEWKQPKYRATQILEWAWKNQVKDFDQMTNLPNSLRNQLREHFFLNNPSIKERQISSDDSLKLAIQLTDEQIIEGVLIPHKNRVTACVSSQVGCSLACKFCATGYLKFKRNLHSYEIYDQVSLLQQQAISTYGNSLSNIVFMGMGEPLLNYRNVLTAIDYITSEKGMNISAKRITVSTAGIAKMIQKLGDDNVRFELALSLHAATDPKRSQIMPINETNSLTDIKEALQYFYTKTKNQITLEYILFDQFNDSIEDADALYRFCKTVPCKINIIEYNPILESEFKNACTEKIEYFKKYLTSKGIIVNVRKSRGKDIDAACGQLALRKIRS